MAGESLLLQALSKGKNDYLSQDPLFRAGALVGQAQLAPAQNNLQAVLLPLLQGGISGTMQHYGQQNALAESLKDTSNIYKQITGKDYSPPEDYSFQSGQGAIFQALQDQQNKQKLDELTAKNAFTKENTLLRNNMVQNPDGSVSLAPGAEKVIQTKAKIEADAKAGAKSPKDFFESLTAPEKQVARLVPKFADKLEEIANEYAALGKEQGAIGYQFKSFVSGTKANDLNSRIKLLLPKVIKLLGQSGNLNEQEQVRALESSLGNWTSNPTEISSRIKETSNLLRDVSIGVLESAKIAKETGGQGLIDQMKASSPPTVPPGFKLQRNKKTGETRIVPL